MFWVPHYWLWVCFPTLFLYFCVYIARFAPTIYIFFSVCVPFVSWCCENSTIQYLFIIIIIVIIIINIIIIKLCVYNYVSLTSDSSEPAEDIIVRLGTVTVSDMGMHHMLIILTLTFIQGHTDLNHENIKKINHFRNYASNAHQLSCEDSPTTGLYDHYQSDDLDLHSRPQVRLKLDYFLTCNILDNISAVTFKCSMALDLWMPYTCYCSFWWPWPWCKVTVGRQRWKFNVACSWQLTKP